MSNESGLRKRLQEMQQRWEVEAQEAHRQRLGFKRSSTDCTGCTWQKPGRNLHNTQAITGNHQHPEVFHSSLKFHLSWFLEGIWLPATFQLNSFASFARQSLRILICSSQGRQWLILLNTPWHADRCAKLTLRAQQLQEEMAFLRQSSQRTEAQGGCTLLQMPA